VTVAVISYGATEGRQLALGGVVDGVVENGGTCTLSLTGPGTPVSVTHEGLADAGSTSCGEMLVQVDAAGVWQAVLAYESATSSGSSVPEEVAVP
jgi:hypothetical protein